MGSFKKKRIKKSGDLLTELNNEPPTKTPLMEEMNITPPNDQTTKPSNKTKPKTNNLEEVKLENPVFGSWQKSDVENISTSLPMILPTQDETIEPNQYMVDKPIQQMFWNQQEIKLS